MDYSGRGDGKRIRCRSAVLGGRGWRRNPVGAIVYARSNAPWKRYAPRNQVKGKKPGRHLKSGLSVLVAIHVIVAAHIGPLLHRGYSETTHWDHIETPDGPGSGHPGHNHAFCMALVPTSVVPGGVTEPRLDCGLGTLALLPDHSSEPHTTTRLILRSRGPPHS